MSIELDFEALQAEVIENVPPDASHWIERLIHTYIGGPVTTLFTQLEIIQRALDRKPEMVPSEVESMKRNLAVASDNIRKIVRALAAAARAGEETEE